MGLFVESLYSDDNALEIYFRESELMLKEFLHRNIMDDNIFFEAEEEGNDIKKQGVLGSLFRRIKEFIIKLKERISGFIHAIENSVGEKITPEMYIQSGTGQLRIEEDIENATKQIEEEILSERKGVQAISKMVKKISGKTNLPIDSIVDDKVIGSMIDKVNAFAVKDGGKVLTAAAATAISSRLSKSIKASKGITDDIDKLTKDVENIYRDIHRQKAKDYEESGHKFLKLLENVAYATGKTVGRAQKYYSIITKPLKKFNKSYSDAKRKEIKKEIKQGKKERRKINRKGI